MRVRYEILMTVEADGRSGPFIVFGMIRNAMRKVQIMQKGEARIAATYVVHEEERDTR